MLERQLCAVHVCATFLWLAAFTLAILAIFVPPKVGALGVVLAAAGATLNVKHWLHEGGRREIEAFEMGQQAATHIRPI